MKPGAYISGIGHVGLIGWLLFGPGFSAEPLPFEVTEVAVISGADFEAVMAGGQPDTPVIETAQPAAPEPEPAPEPVEEAPAPEPIPEPTPVEPPANETPPDLSQLEPLPPQTEVEDTPPPEPVAPAVDQSATLVTGATMRPKPRPAPRVAPTPIAQPEPDTEVADVAQDQTAPEEAADTPVDEQDQTAPEAAATEIVTEADELDATEDAQVSAAPTTSVRPSARPNRPVPQEQPKQSDTQSSVESALADALATEDPAPARPSGPPLTRGEQDALRVAVSQCWNVGSLSSAALATTVTIAMDMTADGKPVSSSLRMLNFTGGTDASAKQAFEAARRAIIRCGANGYNLPTDKYDQWQEIEMTFNPAKMRLK